MIECIRFIIREVGTREGEERGLKVGRPESFRMTWTTMMDCNAKYLTKLKGKRQRS